MFIERIIKYLRPDKQRKTTCRTRIQSIDVLKTHDLSVAVWGEADIMIVWKDRQVSRVRISTTRIFPEASVRSEVQYPLARGYCTSHILQSHTSHGTTLAWPAAGLVVQLPRVVYCAFRPVSQPNRPRLALRLQWWLQDVYGSSVSSSPGTALSPGPGLLMGHKKCFLSCGFGIVICKSWSLPHLHLLPLLQPCKTLTTLKALV